MSTKKLIYSCRKFDIVVPFRANPRQGLPSARKTSMQGNSTDWKPMKRQA